MASLSVLIPAYQSQTFISNTLDSLSNQAYRNFEVIISIDKSDDKTEQIIKKWSQNHINIPTKIYCQTDHLGWVKNVNFLLEKCKTKYFMVLPHDDILDETYLLKLVQCLEINPQACAAFSDIKCFGGRGLLRSRLGIKILEKFYPRLLIISQKSIRGNRFERTHDFLKHHFKGIEFRGIVNKEMMSNYLLIPENHSIYGVANIWGLQMALKGELIRVPEVLYHKRFHANSFLGKSSREFKTKAWIEHCVDCVKIIIRHDFNQDEIIQLIEASKSRLFRSYFPVNFKLLDFLKKTKLFLYLKKKERISLIDIFEKKIPTLTKVNFSSNLQFIQKSNK